MSIQNMWISLKQKRFYKHVDLIDFVAPDSCVNSFLLGFTMDNWTNMSSLRIGVVLRKKKTWSCLLQRSHALTLLKWLSFERYSYRYPVWWQSSSFSFPNNKLLYYCVPPINTVNLKKSLLVIYCVCYYFKNNRLKKNIQKNDTIKLR